MRDKVEGFEAKIAELAARQHGVVSAAQLKALGFDRRAVHRRATAGRLHRLHRGVYAVGHQLIGWRGHWLAAVLACGEGAVLSHRAAAAVWELRPSRSPVVDVTVPSYNGRSKQRGIRLHYALLVPSDVTRRDGIPVTTPVRTVIDLAGVLARRPLERMLDEAERLRLCTASLLMEALEAHPTRRGSRMLRQVLSDHQIGTTLTRSELEEVFLKLCRTHSLPSPEVNVRTGRYLVDFLWRDDRVIVETDGLKTHRTRAAFERDRARDARLTVMGYRVVRFTYRQVVREPAAVAAVLSSLVASR
jgi:very-short-patch-repair endonuclease